ncbi:MAG: CoA-binding protein [Candidatus Nezhaarchaeota archaeon]|nr:CoA-binding protein [Candidatus Nezhaarchaeota archaeon]MCX8142588.1 CoA-binding protein [Candidatus Nezhaarchaeota archaeon]
MAILIDEKTRVLVQGITGRFGTFVTRLMVDYGTNVVAGVTPGRGGQRVWDVPVFDTVKEAVEAHGPIDASLIVVPGPEAKAAAMEAMDCGIKLIHMEVERVPLHDTLELLAYAKRRGVRIIGPGSGGIISAGKAVIGMIGAAEEIAKVAFRPGRVGIISRSGGQTSTLGYIVCQAGLGVSTAIHLGSAPILGTTAAELLPLFQEDEETDAVAYFGEIGTKIEEEAAEVIKEGKYRKPLVAYIAGRGLTPGIRFSHASAIIEGGRGTAESKIKALREAGAYVVDKPEDIGVALVQLLKS